MTQDIRLTEKEILVIKNSFKNHFEKSDKLWLFGSRVDVNKKGGDIDLYIETNITDLKKLANIKIKFLVDIKIQIGEQKIDVILNPLHAKQNLPIYTEAKTTGVKLV